MFAVFCPWTYRIIIPKDDIEFYLKVNNHCFKVKKTTRGWIPVDKKKWTGEVPLKISNPEINKTIKTLYK